MTVALTCRLAESAFDPWDELRQFAQASQGAGAVSSFTGTARPLSSDGEAVEAMFLDHHPRLTLESMRAIVDAAARFGCDHRLVIHRCGVVLPGEPIVLVAAASAHRRAAIAAVEYMIDRLKTDAVFWKREDRASGSAWIEPRAEDHAAHARWEQ